MLEVQLLKAEKVIFRTCAEREVGVHEEPTLLGSCEGRTGLGREVR